MKFTWETAEDKPKEIVAYIDGDGDLVLRTRLNGGDAVALRKNGSMVHCAWTPHALHVERVFLTGDRITIEF